MNDYTNALGQPVGHPLPDWQPRLPPPRTALHGRFCRLEPLDPARHADDLFAANARAADARAWTYLPYGPFESQAAYTAWLQASCLGADPLFHAIVDQQTQQATGLASYLRISPADGVIEVGHINYSPLLQRTAAATEAMYLMMVRVFDELGYRRYEWKCDALNAPSRAAARRLGFRFEGIFRNATVYKGRNRDTAWFAMTDADWPHIKAAFEAWLSPGNFDAAGRQRTALATPGQ